MDDNLDQELRFGAHPLKSGIILGVVLGVGAACADFALQYHQAWWFGSMVAALIGLLVVVQYLPAVVTLRAFDLALSAGYWVRDEICIPLESARIRVRRGWIDRVLDAGELIIQVGNEEFRVTIWHISRLQRVLAQRRVALLHLTRESYAFVMSD